MLGPALAIERMPAPVWCSLREQAQVTELQSEALQGWTLSQLAVKCSHGMTALGALGGNFVLKLASIYRLAAPAGACRVAGLNHEVADDAVHLRSMSKSVNQEDKDCAWQMLSKLRQRVRQAWTGSPHAPPCCYSSRVLPAPQSSCTSVARQWCTALL